MARARGHEKRLHLGLLLGALTVLPLAVSGSPARAECVGEGDTTTCTGAQSGGIVADTPNLVVRDLTTDVAPPAGQPAIWMPGVVNADVDLGSHSLVVSGVPAIAAIGNRPGSVTLDFTGTINASGPNTPQGGTSGINILANAGSGFDATVRSTGNITVNASRTATNTNPNNVGINVTSGANSAASLTSAGAVSVSVVGPERPFITSGLSVNGGTGGASLTNTGDVTVAAPVGTLGNGIVVGSTADTVINSTGNVSVDIGTGTGYGIQATGLRNTVVSRGNIASDAAGIVTNGAMNPTTFVNGVAEVTQIDSVGDISTSQDVDASAIWARGNQVSVASTGTLTTQGNYASGIVAARNYRGPVGANAEVVDFGGTSASVTNKGDITTQGTSSYGLLVGSAGATTVRTEGRITTAGQSAAGIRATGSSVTIDSLGSIKTSGAGAQGILVTTLNGNVTINAGAIDSSGDGIVVQKTGTASSGSINLPAINVNGAITSGGRGIGLDTISANFAPAGMNPLINIAQGASVTGLVGIGSSVRVNNGDAAAPPTVRAVSVQLENNGTITGTGGTALALQQAGGTIRNRGTINGAVIFGLGGIENYGQINGDVTLSSNSGPSPLSYFAFEGDIGVSGNITGGQGVDAFAEIFTTSGTTIVGGGLPTLFDRYGVVTNLTSTDAVVTVEVAQTPVGATPSLWLLGTGSIINRANLAEGTTAGGVPFAAVESYGFGLANRGPFGGGFSFEGAGIGASSFTNEAAIDGQVLLTAGSFINTGTLSRNSSGRLSIVTARVGQAFTFNNSGTIRLVDTGARARTAPDQFTGSPFTDPNAYSLPEPALILRMPLSGELTPAGLFNPATLTNSGVIEGGLLARMTASELTFDNSGTISGLAGSDRTVPALMIATGQNYDSAVGTRQNYEPAPTIDANSVAISNAAAGTISGGIITNLFTRTLSFTNAGTINRGVNEFGEAIGVYLYQHRITPPGVQFRPDGDSVTFMNSGNINAGVELDTSALSVAATNSGRIIAGGVDFSEDSALTIGNGTVGSHSVSFTNVAGGVIRSNAEFAGIGLEIEAEAGQQPNDPEGLPSAAATVNVVNAGVIAADRGGGLLAPEVQGGPASVALGLGMVLSTSSVLPSSITLTNEAGGVISATGARSVAVAAETNSFTLINRGTISGRAGTNLAENEVWAADFGEGGPDAAETRRFVAGAIQTINSTDLIRNAGTINGSVDLGAGNDVLELAETSIVNGFVDLGAGTDEVRLVGLTSNVGQIAVTRNAEALRVQSGAWQAATAQSDYGLLDIAQGAVLTVAENTQGELAITTRQIQLGGRLNVELATDREPGDLTGLTIGGAGSLHLTGPATFLVDDATGLQHTGGTFVDNGELLLTTEFAGDITTSGDGLFELSAGGDFTGDLVNNGIFRFNREDSYEFTGDFSGTGLLEKRGAGTLNFTGLYAFTGTTSILGGTVVFAGQIDEDAELELSEGATVDLSTAPNGQQTIAELEGTGGTVQLGQTNLVIEQSNNTVFAGDITGTGTLTKQGEGDLKLNGDGTAFTGTAAVQAGTLSVNGNFANANFVVQPGGTLGGAGVIGGTQVNSGGTLAPGNSIDTLDVAGNIVFTAGSIYEVEVDAAGNADRLNASGTATLGGAAVNVLAANGNYRPITDYTILTAAGGISGTFGSVTDNLAFLDPSLSYSANAVTLRLVRNDIDFGAFATTPNQSAVAGLIESFGFGNTLYNEAVLLADGSGDLNFETLTGEVYPAYGAAVVETAEMLRRQTVGSMAAGDGGYVWATGLHNRINSDGGANQASFSSAGIVGGVGYGAGPVSASVGLGMLDQGPSGSMVTESDITFVIGRFAYSGFAGLSVSAGAQYGWVDGATRRQTSLGAINQAVTGNVDGNYLQLSGQLAYRLPVGGSWALEPFVGISHVSAKFDGLTEVGAATALTLGAIDRTVTFGDIGLRLSGDENSNVRPFASAAYRRAWGDRASVANVGFAGNAGSVLISGVPIAEDAAELSGGVVVSSGAFDLEVSYDGTISDTFVNHGINAGLKFRF